MKLYQEFCQSAFQHSVSTRSGSRRGVQHSVSCYKRVYKLDIRMRSEASRRNMWRVDHSDAAELQ